MYDFPAGVVRLEIIPETAKLNVNTAPPVELFGCCSPSGEREDSAREIAAAIDDWRRPGSGGTFDSFYMAQTPSFRAPHASFQEIEELLLIKGVTPDLFYGTYAPADTRRRRGPVRPRLVPRGGLMDCLSVYGTRDRVDANTAAPAVLAAVGLEPVRHYRAGGAPRRCAAHRKGARRVHAGGGRPDRPPARRRKFHGHDARHRPPAAAQRRPLRPEADRRRAGQVHAAEANAPFNVLRWYDTAWSN